jgi:hypothetical protein
MSLQLHPAHTVKAAAETIAHETLMVIFALKVPTRSFGVG